MTTPASQTVSSSPNPSTQGSPRSRDWGNLKTGEPGSAFRGISRGKGSRGGGIKGGRSGGHPPNASGQKGSSLPETASSTPSPSVNSSSIPRRPPVPPSIAVTTNVGGKSVSGTAERGGRPRPGSRKQPRVTAPPSPLEAPQTAPPTPSRSANHRRRSQQGKGPTTTAKSTPPNAVKSQKSRGGSTPASQTILRKDVPPHLAAAHEAEIRHDIDALVERVRAVAMAENRPTTPGSHIDWAGDEDDSLPDLDDWGITTTHANITHDEDKSEEISPILADTLKPLPEPNSDVQQEEEEREVETYDDHPNRAKETSAQPSLPTEPAAIMRSTVEKAPERCVIVPTVAEELSSATLPNGKPSLHPSLPLKPVAAMESLRARGQSVSKPSGLPQKPSAVVAEEDPFVKTAEGLAESIHAPSVDEYSKLEISSASSSERGLAASIHATVSSLPESHSAPNLLTGVSRTHSRSQTEGRPRGQPHTAPVSHRHGRSGASSPLGKNVFTHSRNHSTPARPPQTARPVITGEAISRLARTIGGLGPTARTQAVPISKDSTISS